MRLIDSICTLAASTLIFMGAVACAQSSAASAKPSAPPIPSSSGQEMQLSDQPNFSVAGVTDWTAVGGHGSDSTLRVTESLASATVALKASSSARRTSSTGRSGDAESFLRAGERSEASGDALAAVHAFERAATLDPSEANYFAWGSELLLHRAIWQAEEVFRKGTVAFPQSARMNTALGTALFSGARYGEAAERLCSASDLNPKGTEAYLFMGRMQIIAPEVLPCVEPHLARFVEQEPSNALAKYLYAMTLLKSKQIAPRPDTVEHARSLLDQAVALDPQCGDAYLELGILSNAQHDNQQAIRFYTKAIETTPSLADAHYRLGVLYDRAGDHDQAAQQFKLHDEIKRQQAEVTERQRRDIKQFIFTTPGVASPTSQP